MGEPFDSCIAYWKLENVNAEIGNPLIVNVGSDFTKDGQFNKGSYQAVTNRYLASAAVGFDHKQFVYDIYFVPDFNVVNGVAVATHVLLNWFYNSSNKAGLWIGPSGMQLVYRVNNVGTVYNCTHVDVDMTAGLPYRLVVFFNQAGIAAGADRCRMYFQNALVYNSVVTPAASSVSGGTYWVHTNRNHNITTHGVVDNWKVHNSTSQEAVDGINGNLLEEWPPEYIAPNRFNRIAGLNQGRVV